MTAALPVEIERLTRQRTFDPAPLMELFTGLTHGEVAEHLGVKRVTVRAWRHGRSRIGESTADRIGTRLVGHPCLLWPEWFDDQALARARM